VKEKLVINKKSLKGEDGYKTFSIRIKDETVDRLTALSKQTNRSRNDLINMLLDYAMDYCEIHDEDQPN
jgi:predicted DNA-binding protein